ncbi:E3 ubiquitin-protein ligase RNF169 isoform X2 [Stigmatopora nigra]
MAAAAKTRRISEKASAAKVSRSALALGSAATLQHDARESFVSTSRNREAERDAVGESQSQAAATTTTTTTATSTAAAAVVVVAAMDPDPDGARGSELLACPSVFPECGEESLSAAPNVKHKQERDDMRRRSARKQEKSVEELADAGARPPTRGFSLLQGVPSDSENEEPAWPRLGRFSAFVRRSRTSATVGSAGRRSRSCTEAGDHRGRKKAQALPDALRGPPLGLPLATSGVTGSRRSPQAGSAAGILLSSENSRSASAAGILLSSENSRSSSAPGGGGGGGGGGAAACAERSVSPESNDSISEELNHFKPIVCSPRTPPKRMADGRLLEPALVKSTPRNLSWRLHRPTSYEAGPAALRRWRQIQLDRRSLEVASKGTLTSPVKDPREVSPPGKAGEAAAASATSPAVPPSNKRKLIFELPDSPRPKMRVPAARYAGDLTFAASSRTQPGPGLGALLGRGHSFSPYAGRSGSRLRGPAGKSPPGPVAQRRDPAQRPLERNEGPPAATVKYFLRSCRRPDLRRSRRIDRRR